MRRFVVTSVAGAALALVGGIGATGLPAASAATDATVVASYPTPSAPHGVRYAFGAAWVGAASKGALVRVMPGAASSRTTSVPGTLVDFTEGYGRMWVLWRTGSRSYVASVDPKSGRIVGGARRTRVAGRPGRIRAGAGAVWTSTLGQNPRARGTLSRINPRNRRVSTRRWAMPSDFLVERAGLWSFVGLKLVNRSASTLKVRRRVRAFSGFEGVTYGLGSFWTSSLGPTGNGGVTRISPTAGRGEVFEFPSDFDFDDAGGITTGAGSIWALWENQVDEVPPGEDPWNLAGFSPSGTAGSALTVPVSQVPGDQSLRPTVAYGGGSLWVTDPGGERVLQITPPVG